MSNSDMKLRTFILYSDIIHLGFPQRVKPIEPRTSPRKGPPKKKNQKEINILL